MSAPSGPEADTAAVGLLLPAALADAAGAPRLLLLPLDGRTAGGITVAGALARLRGESPGVYSRICDETGGVRRYVNLYVDGRDVRDLGGASTLLAPGAEILVLQSIAGG